MTNFTILPYDLEEIGRSGHGTINCQIKGYWSSSPITLYINRNFYGSEQGWKVTISHSSGGREPKEVESDMDAAINFADAMRAMATVGHDLMAPISILQLETFHKLEREVRRAQDEAEKAALAAKVEADPPMGELAAKQIVLQMSEGALKIVRFYLRGSDARFVTVSVSKREKTKFYVNGQSSAKLSVIATLTGLSTREDVSVRS